ncbi:MAG: iron ABC transporter permease [Alphaproteobacteria bacterium]
MTAQSFDPSLVVARLKGLRTANPWHLGLLVSVLLLVLAPVALLVLGSFSLRAIPTDISFSELGLANYIAVWTDPGTYALFYNTFVYVTGATVFGISIAAVLAWLVERTDIKGKIWIYAGVPMTLAMPGMLQAMAWVLLASPRIGFINKFAMDFLGFDAAPLDVYSLGGMIFVEGLRLVPTAFLMFVPLLRSMDPALEEAAAMSGAAPASMLRKVTMRLMLPGLVAVLIYQFITALEVFEVPGILGLPADIYVFSTKIYAIIQSSTFLPAYGQANALAMLYLVLAIVATVLYARVIARSERFAVITGKGYRPRVMKLGRWHAPALALVTLFLAFSIILPLLVFIFVSFLPYLRPPTPAAFASMTLENYREVFETELIGTALWNTVLMVALTTTLTVVLSFFISLVVVRSRFWGRKLLDQLAFLPHAIPGIVMGLAFLWLFVILDKGGVHMVGGTWAIAIAFTVGFIAYGTRSMNAALLQIHKDLEEAAYVSGAVKWRVMWRIFYPLMLPSLIGVAVWTMLHAVRQASVPLILYEGERNQVLSVLIWNMWDDGQIQAVGAMGAMMILGLLLITLALRIAGFGRGKYIQ